MSNHFYETVVKEKNNARTVVKKISAIMCYALVLVLFAFIALNNWKYFVLILALGIIVDAVVIVITWKYLQKEYEYSFEYGRMSIAKIYGKSKRKLTFEADIDTMLMIAPATDEYIAKAEHFDIDKRVEAVSDRNSDNIWLVVSGGDDTKCVLAFFEADDKALSILKSENPIAFIRKK